MTTATFGTARALVLFCAFGNLKSPNQSYADRKSGTQIPVADKTISVQFRYSPQSHVTVNLGAEYMILSGSTTLVFTPANYATPQYIKVRLQKTVRPAVQDPLITQDQAIHWFFPITTSLCAVISLMREPTAKSSIHPLSLWFSARMHVYAEYGRQRLHIIDVFATQPFWVVK